MDNSGSVFDGLAEIRSAIETLNGQRKSEDLLGLIVFSSPAEIRTQGLSVDPLESSRIDARGDLTAIWHAVDQGLNLLDGCEFETKYLILLTDGENNVPYNMKDSNANARDLREKAMNMQVNICPIGVESDAFQILILWRYWRLIVRIQQPRILTALPGCLWIFLVMSGIFIES